MPDIFHRKNKHMVSPLDKDVNSFKVQDVSRQNRNNLSLGYGSNKTNLSLGREASQIKHSKAFRRM